MNNNDKTSCVVAGFDCGMGWPMWMSCCHRDYDSGKIVNAKSSKCPRIVPENKDRHGTPA
ncbi:hypothetical protein DPMN_007849 [Dreissena polymorpha]|uniref:Uncharacterized protein n=1 Tax=Dreissena polymorpha TaxID=45954 RepID=A0A9D4MWL1_DREPO|nr:hypothetical protein DPMN_007849 [Dreissena polymorpha]